MPYVTSEPVKRWLEPRREAIDNVAAGHAKVGELTGPERPLDASKPPAHAYVLVIVGQFQGFIRDMHDLAVVRQPREEPGPGRAVRHLALTRLLHHHRPDEYDTVAAHKTHRGHAVIEQVHSDLKNSAPAHLPSGKFAVNAAWRVLAVIAFNLTRAAATLPGPTLAKSTTATIRRKLIAIPARIASSARRVTLHLPTA